MLNAKRAAVIWVNVFSCGLGSFLIRAGCALDKSVALWSLAAALKPLGLRPSLEEVVCPQSYFLHVSFSLWMLLAVSHAFYLSVLLPCSFAFPPKPSGSLQPMGPWLLFHHLCYCTGRAEKAALTFEFGRFIQAQAVGGMDMCRTAC